MRNIFRHNRHERRRHHPDDIPEKKPHKNRSFRGSRLFDYGELRLLLLTMIAEQPRHGYQLIKLIEERFGGSYSPSPGVIYPTLSWLEDMGYVTIQSETVSNRKSYGITEEGNAFLIANRTAANALLQRTGSASGGLPAPVLRAMENLKVAIRLRLKEGNLDEATTDKIAAAIDAAAKAVEKS